MPRSNLCVDKNSKRFNYVAGMLACGMRQQELTSEQVYKKTGIPVRTINDRLQHPEQIRLADLYKICDAVGVKISFELKEIPE